MTSEQLDDLEHLARTSGRKLHPDKALALIARVRELEAERDQLAAEVERLWALLHSGAWHRRDGRTYLAIRLADGADLSCRATREDAIRAALAEVPTREEGPQPVVVVPDVPGPDKVCWKQGPAMHRCTYPRGHKGPHQWEPAREDGGQ